MSVQVHNVLEISENYLNYIQRRGRYLRYRIFSFFYSQIPCYVPSINK